MTRGTRWKQLPSMNTRKTCMEITIMRDFFLLLLHMVLQDTLIIFANSLEASVCGRVPNRRETGGRGGAQMSI